MRGIINLIFTFTITLSAIAQNVGLYENMHCKVYFDESYGEFERNKFDIIIPDSRTPVPLIIYVHGGGFLHGDKKSFYKREEDVRYFLENNIAVATINYRFRKPDDSLGVKVCISDVTRALQFLRHQALKYNIDKSRVGCYGISAGAGSSLFLAFNYDMAIKGDTTLLGETTRIKCAGAIATQSTYNLFKWKKIIPWMRLLSILERKEFNNAIAGFYGYAEYKNFKKSKREIVAGIDMLTMINSKAPPIYLMNLLDDNFPKTDNIVQHHKKHAVIVSRKLNKFNVENYLFTSKQVEQECDIKYSIKEFLLDNLK